MLLQHLTILLVEPNVSDAERLAAHLRAEGASVHVRFGVADGLEVTHRLVPDVLVSELDLPDGKGHDLLAALRRLPRCNAIPGVALVKREESWHRPGGPEERFEKYLGEPVRLFDVTDAICCVAGDRNIPHPGTSVSLEALGDGLFVHDYRWLLGALNAATPYRYTALLRFDQDRVANIWTFDRNQPTHDPFVHGVPIEETPCAEVRRIRAPVMIDDAGGEPNVPSRAVQRMRSFVGVPLGSDAEPPRGALCHFDDRPRTADPRAVEYLVRAAGLIRVGRGRGRARA